MPHSLEAYIPKDRRQAMAGGHSLPDRADGAVMFADISGFTPLTDALVEKLGPRRGVDELTKQLNHVYEALITQVDHYGGSAIAFSGDAITCWFPEKEVNATLRPNEVMDSTSVLHPPPSPFHSSSFRAVSCALRMQQAMAPFAAIETPAGEPIEIAIKINITAGPVRRFLVGDPYIQYLDVLAGQTLDRLDRIELLAQKGEILVGPEIISLRL
jgi:class 3 adenylate cyclase